MKRIYAILDITADAIVGGLQLHSHEAAAVRMFRDVAAAEGTMIHNHPEEFKLLCLGQLEDRDEPKTGILAHTITATERPVEILRGASLVALTTEDKTNG